ncbi:MAG: hypothetical protein UV70_C0009G0008 [Parcubacteria group bacterium GW2011_GWA2_43_13]|nr:MAG: hypothetical protein UV70_C0009G0008 [Parcubacteria group bacterium GW2011_GWA2_43_13]
MGALLIEALRKYFVTRRTRRFVADAYAGKLGPGRLVVLVTVAGYRLARVTINPHRHHPVNEKHVVYHDDVLSPYDLDMLTKQYIEVTMAGTTEEEREELLGRFLKEKRVWIHRGARESVFSLFSEETREATMPPGTKINWGYWDSPDDFFDVYGIVINGNTLAIRAFTMHGELCWWGKTTDWSFNPKNVLYGEGRTPLTTEEKDLLRKLLP